MHARAAATRPRARALVATGTRVVVASGELLGDGGADLLDGLRAFGAVLAEQVLLRARPHDGARVDVHHVHHDRVLVDHARVDHRALACVAHGLHGRLALLGAAVSVRAVLDAEARAVAVAATAAAAAATAAAHRGAFRGADRGTSVGDDLNCGRRLATLCCS
eukprot:CAMPEP_0198307924 /NCGR_PEP_ID=MMETSP1450-20131203/719_1 /TAXON_ID=753684 ORGANISM="Madagascaria erythrocladiodes, Strain CCMP3234" /NCGR_SAMPLE_ID=MMETSP1450 /ASSEMBLY_ACC=CAM_ASM_001115 /LENGTH=162 /DNA_ID=CAMNT_0044010547 /DNA_START=362 /DNA_END=847 /DNA_ORIENTATION=+